jgi:cytochrome d ubiquinol oxidase subunit I
MESTFLGLWIFGWDKLSKKAHAAVMWLVAIGSNLSAIWILSANSFMQEPVGYVLRNGRAEMTDFFALITNPHLWLQFPHVFTGAMASAGFLVIGISAYHLMKKSEDREAYTLSMKFAFIYAFIGVILVSLIGHSQMQYMVETQPMKVAAAEALWDSENPASLSLFTIGDEKNRKDIFAIRVPALLSILSYNKVDAEVKGINEIQKEYEEKYGPGDYVPSVIMSYWMFRLMAGAGTAMLILVIIGIIRVIKNNFEFSPLMSKILLWSMFLPLIGHSTGWMFAEMGRQPWAVFGLFKTEAGVSNTVTGGEVLFSLLGYIVIYLLLIIAEVFLFKKYAVAGTQSLTEQE